MPVVAASLAVLRPPADAPTWLQLSPCVLTDVDNTDTMKTEAGRGPRPHAHPAVHHGN